MAISKERKNELVAQYKEILSSNAALILTNYSGLSVKEIQGLRKDIREVGGEFHVIKNTLIKLAFEETGLSYPENALEGPTAIGVALEDIPGVAKAIVDLARETEIIKVKGAVIEGEVYDEVQVIRLADLPPLPIIQAQLIGLIQSPGGQVANLVAGSVRQALNVLKAYSEQEPGPVQ